MEITSQAGECGDQCNNCKLGKKLVKEKVTGFVPEDELLVWKEVVCGKSQACF